MVAAEVTETLEEEAKAIGLAETTRVVMEVKG